MVRIEWWRCAGKGDTETRVITVPVSGAGRRFPAEGSVSVNQRRESRGLVGVNTRFPAFAAVIGAHQIALVAADQTCEFLDRMLTDWRTPLLAPLRL
jgi:hypothetical protein